jgi:hypothetical protein
VSWDKGDKSILGNCVCDVWVGVFVCCCCVGDCLARDGLCVYILDFGDRVSVEA